MNDSIFEQRLFWLKTFTILHNSICSFKLYCFKVGFKSWNKGKVPALEWYQEESNSGVIPGGVPRHVLYCVVYSNFIYMFTITPFDERLILRGFTALYYAPFPSWFSTNFILFYYRVLPYMMSRYCNLLYIWLNFWFLILQA